VKGLHGTNKASLIKIILSLSLRNAFITHTPSIVQSEEHQSSISPGDGTELQSKAYFDQFNVTGNSFVLTLGIDFLPSQNAH